MNKGAAEILKMLEARQTAATPKALAEFIGADTERFAELVRIFLKEHHRPAQRASNVFMILAETQPVLFEPHFGKLVRESARKNSPSVVRRNVIRLLQFIDVPKKLRATVFCHCLDIIDDPHAEKAVRAFAIAAAARIGRLNDPLLSELRLVVQKHLPFENAPSFRHHAQRLLNDDVKRKT